MNFIIQNLHVFNADKIMVNSFNGGEQSEVNFSKVENMENVQEVKGENVKVEEVKVDGAGAKDTRQTETAGSKEQDSELVAKLMPIFWNDRNVLNAFLEKVVGASNSSIVVEVARLINQNLISRTSCKSVLWKILYEARIYTASLSNWNILLNQKIT